MNKIQELLRASGYVTNGQAWDLAKIILDYFVHHNINKSIQEAQEIDNQEDSSPAGG